MLTLPDVRQKKAYDCGRAATECVLKHFSATANLSNLATTPTDGTDPRAIEACLRLAGRKIVSGEMSLADLRHFTRSGRPVIAVVNGHYVVVSGVSRGRVHYQDPLEGPQRCSERDFVMWWKEADRLGVVYDQFGIAVA